MKNYKLTGYSESGDAMFEFEFKAADFGAASLFAGGIVPNHNFLSVKMYYFEVTEVK